MERGFVIVVNRTPFLIYLFLWLLLAGTAIYDHFTPLGISDCVWYFLPLLLSSHVGGRRFSLHLAGLITVLALVGFYLSPPGVLPQNALVARLIIVIAVWVIAFLIEQRKVANHTRHGTERALRCTNQCNQIITRATGEDSLLRDICHTIISEGGYRMAWVGFAEDDAARSIRIGAVAGHDEGYLDAAKITWSATDPRGCGPAGTSIRTGKKVVCNDFLKDPTTLPWQPEAARRGYAACLVLPLLHLEKPMGMLMIYASEPNAFGTEEIQLLEHLAENLSFGLVTLRQREAQARAEAALHQAHQFHLKLLYQAPALIWRAGLDAQCDWFNQTWLAFTGRTLEQELGDGWAEGVFPEDLPACLAHYREAFAARRAFEVEYRLRRHDGQYRWIVDHGIPYQDDAGNFAGYFGYCFDITDRRQAQESLNFHGFVLNHVAEGIYLLRVADGTIFYANPGLEQMFGYPPGALSGQPAAVLYAPAEKSPAVMWAEIAERLAAKGTWTGELLGRKPDGTVFWTHVTAASSTHPAHGPVYLFTHADISARKEMEQSLLASEARLRTYLHQAGDAFFAHDQAGRLLDVNQQACTSLGYTREELLQLFIWDFDVDCKPAPVVALWQEMSPGQVVSFLSHHRRKDGSCFPIEVVLRREEFLEQPLFLALVRDVSRRIEQENELRRMNRLYAAANQINQTIVQVSAREPMFGQVCQLLVETGGFAMAWVGWLKDEGSQIQVAGRYGDAGGYLLDLNVLPNQGPVGTGPTGISMRERRTVVCKDIATDPLMAHWRDKALAHGFAALLAVPIRLQGEIAGALVVYAREKNFFGPPEIALLESSARDISIGLDQLDREARRRQAESALRQSEARLQGYFNTLSSGIGITSPTAGWLDANPRLQEMLGYSLAELRSLNWIALTHPDDREKNVALYQDVLSGKRDGYTMDKRFLCKTGEALWTNLAVRCVRQADGQVDCFVAMIFDISQRKSAELALQESELRRKLAMESANMGLWDWDMTTGRAVWSEAHEALWGYQPGEFTGDHRGFLSRVHLEDQARLHQTGLEALARRTIFACEHRVVWPDGSIHWIYSTGRHIFDAGGNPVRMLGVVYDISARKEAEARVLGNEARLQSILQSAMDGFWRLDTQGRILEVNAALCRMTGYAQTELVGQSVALVEAIENAAEIESHVHKIITAGYDRFESRHRRKDGSVYVVEVSAQYHQESGEANVVCFMRDITRRLQLEEELRQSEKKYRSLFDLSPVPCAINDAAGRILQLNDAFIKTFHYTLEDIPTLEEWWVKAYPDPVYRQQMTLAGQEQYARSVLEGQPMEAMELHIRCKNGDARTVLANGVPLGLDKCGLRMVVLYDITERKQAELALLESQDRLRLIGENLPESYIYQYAIMADGSGQFFYVSPSVESVHGVAAEVFLRDAGQFLALMDPTYRAGFASALEVSARELSDLVMELKFRRSDGALRWHRLHARPRRLALDGATVWDGVVTDFTRQRETEYALQASERRHEQTLSALNDGLWEWDMLSGQLQLSPSYYALLGYAPGDFAADFATWKTLLHPEDAWPLEQAVAQAIHTQQPASCEIRLRRQSGDWHWFITRGRVVLYDEAGQPTRMLGILSDFQERKEATLKLARSERLLREAQKTARIGYYINHLATGLWESSPMLDELFGIGPEFVRDTAGWGSLMHPDDREPTVAYFLQVLEAQIPFRKDYRIIRPSDGQLRWMAGYGEFEFDAVGQPLCLLGCVQDITGRVQAESALRENEERLRLALQVSRQGIYDVVDLATGETYTSPEYATMLGYDPAGFHETTAAWISRLHPEDSVQAQTTFGLFLAGELPEYHIEFRLRTRDGQWIWIQSVAQIISRDAQGKPKRIVGTHKDISQRKQMEEVLAASEAQYRQIVETAQEGIWLLDAAGCTTYVNQTLAAMFGYTVPDLIGRSFLELMEDAAIVKAMQFFELHKQGQQKKYDFQFRRQDGSPLWAIVSDSPMFDASGHFTGVLGMLTDITDRQQAEERLRASESQMQFVANHAAIKLAHCDRHQRYKFVNRSYAEMFDLRVEQVVGRQVADILGPENYALVQVQLERVLAGEPVQHEYKMVATRLAGELCTLHVSYVPERAAAGEVIGFVAAITDITMIKSAEAASQRLKVAIDQARESIVFTDQHGTVLYVNQWFQKNSGYLWEEVVNQNVRLLKSGQHSPEFYRQISEILGRGEAWEGRFINRRKNGTFYDEKSLISPVRNEQGKITSYVAVNHDVTREESLQRQVIEAQKMEVIGQLAGGVAHDFNNILAAMSIQLELVTMQRDLPPAVRKSLAPLEIGVEKASLLTGQLLTFSRRQAMEVKSLDLDRMLREQLQMLGRLLGEQLELVIQDPAGSTYIHADSGMMDQVIMNLCINARDAMPKGGRLTVGVQAVEIPEVPQRGAVGARPGRFVCLSVADTGCGMDEDTQRRIFEPFFTTKGVGRGTGLGLATVYGIVQQHEGWIEVASQVGKGTEFRVYFPAGRAAPAVAAPAEILSVAPGYANILVVEDEPAVLEAVVTALQFAGYHVLTATSGAQALESFGEMAAHIDLLFTDMVMPGGVDGWELAEAFRQLNPALAVVITSGYNTRLPAREELARRRMVFLRKPAKGSRITATIQQALAEARAENPPV